MFSGSADSHDKLLTQVSVWSENAASAGGEQDKVGGLLRGQQTGRGRERRKWEQEESRVRGLSGRRMWEGRVTLTWL